MLNLGDIEVCFEESKLMTQWVFMKRQHMVIRT